MEKTFSMQKHSHKPIVFTKIWQYGFYAGDLLTSWSVNLIDTDVQYMPFTFQSCIRFKLYSQKELHAICTSINASNKNNQVTDYILLGLGWSLLAKKKTFTHSSPHHHLTLHTGFSYMFIYWAGQILNKTYGHPAYTWLGHGEIQSIIPCNILQGKHDKEEATLSSLLAAHYLLALLRYRHIFVTWGISIISVTIYLLSVTVLHSQQ